MALLLLAFTAWTKWLGPTAPVGSGGDGPVNGVPSTTNLLLSTEGSSVVRSAGCGGSAATAAAASGTGRMTRLGRTGIGSPGCQGFRTGRVRTSCTDAARSMVAATEARLPAGSI